MLTLCWILRYTSGDVRLWDTLHWDSTASYLKTNGLSGNSDPRPLVTHVQVNNTVAAAAYEDGECLCLCSIILNNAVTFAGNCLEGTNAIMGCRLCGPVEHRDRWGAHPALPKSRGHPGHGPEPGQPRLGLSDRDQHTVRPRKWSRLLEDPPPGSASQECMLHKWFLTTPVWCIWAETMLERQVEGLVLVPGRGSQHPLAALRAGESVYLLDPREEKPWTIHSVYGHPVTCLDVSDTHVAFGVKRAGWAMHDGGNKVCSRRRCDECG